MTKFCLNIASNNILSLKQRKPFLILFVICHSFECLLEHWGMKRKIIRPLVMWVPHSMYINILSQIWKIFEQMLHCIRMFFHLNHHLFFPCHLIIFKCVSNFRCVFPQNAICFMNFIPLSISVILGYDFILIKVAFNSLV